MRDRLSPLFSWRSAIASSDGPRDVRPDGGDAVRGSTQRHVALTLSLHMSERGDSCFPGVPRIAREAGLADRSVQRALRALETSGWLRIEQRKSDGENESNLYFATVPDGYEHDLGGDAPSPKDVTEDAKDPETPPSPRPAVVNRIRTTEAERELAAAVLADFNRQAGTRYTSPDFLGKIIMRHREHPELDAAAHGDVIRRQLARPWWNGAASPSVIYGNGGLFERALQTGPPGRTERFSDLDDV